MQKLFIRRRGKYAEVMFVVDGLGGCLVLDGTKEKYILFKGLYVGSFGDRIVPWDINKHDDLDFEPYHIANLKK